MTPVAAVPSHSTLTPTQAQVEDQLFGRGQTRPDFDPEIGPALRGILEEGFGPLVADRQPSEALFLGKRTLAQVHTCEGFYQASEAEPFAWSPPAARGTVAHKAVELAVTLRRGATPADLVDLAI